MRRSVGTAVSVGLLLAALFGYRAFRRADASQQARDRVLQAVTSIPGFDEDRQTYLDLIEGAHETAFDPCYRNRYGGGRRRLLKTLDADCYRQGVFQAMINLARQADRGDIAIELDHARADEVFWSSF